MSASWALLLNLLTIAVSALLVAFIPALRRPVPSLILGIAVTGVIYLSHIPVFFFWCALCLFLVICMKQLLRHSASPEHLRWKCSIVAIGFVVIIFVLLRLMGTRHHASVSDVLLLIPDMWLLLRMVSFLWEFGVGKIEPELFLYARWITLPFTLQGPLLRYSEFSCQMKSPEENEFVFSPRLFVLGLGQLALGLASYPITQLLMQQHQRWASLLLGLGTAPWGAYLATAGTFHLMEALAQTWRITLPKSFDRPFVQSNLSKFWSSWNVTVTSFFRDALFYQRWGLRKPSVYLNLILVFLLVGLWHGSNLYWALWGLLHGIGFVVYVLYRSEKIPMPRLPATGRLQEFASVTLTYLFVCGCWYLPNKLILLGRL